MTTLEQVTATIHLVRHGRVENPAGVIYGRLPGYHLSEVGIEQARSAARELSQRPIAAIFSSPLERARETADIIAEPHGLDVVVDDRLIETETTLEGVGRNLLAFVRSPGRWWSLRNPLRPTWGESYAQIRVRMREAVDEAAIASAGKEIVLVSHQSPIREAVRSLTNRIAPTVSGLSTPCHTGSVTTIHLEEGRVTGTAYFRPL